MKTVKCLYCEIDIDRNVDKYVQVQKKYAHQACSAIQDVEKETRRQLNEFLFKLWNGNVNFGIVGQQIKTFQSQYNYTLSGILGTLHYCYRIKNLDPAKAQGIGIVPYYYKEARAYFFAIERGKINSSELLDTKKRIVKITPPKSYPIIKLFEISLEEKNEL